MKKKFTALFASTALLSVFNSNAQSQNTDQAKNAITHNQGPDCSIKLKSGEYKKIHVWYTLNNLDTQNSWFVQIARLYGNNISFYDETCKRVYLSNAIELPANSTKKVGLLILESKAFSSMYAFTGVSNDAELYSIPNNKKACVFAIAPYGPRQMDRIDWRLNNADCYSDNYSMTVNFK